MCDPSPHGRPTRVKECPDSAHLPSAGGRLRISLMGVPVNERLWSRYAVSTMIHIWGLQLCACLAGENKRATQRVLEWAEYGWRYVKV